MDKKQKITFLIDSLAIFLFLLFIGSGLVWNPFYGEINLIDEGQIGAWINHLLRGQYLYKDTYAAYGPLYIYPIYIFNVIFGNTVFAIRMVAIVLYSFTGIMIVNIILKFLKIPYLLQWFTIVLLLIMGGASLRQGVGFLSIFLNYIAIEKRNYRWSILAGLSFAYACLTSIDMGIFAGVILALFYVYHLISTDKFKIIVTKISIISLSSLFLFLVFFVWSNSQGWFNSYTGSMIDDLTTYTGINLSIGKNLPNALVMIPRTFSLTTWVKFILSQEIFVYWLILFYIATFYFLFIRIIQRTFQKHDSLILLIALYGFLLSTIIIGRPGHLGFTLAPVYIIFGYYLNILIRIFQFSKQKYEKVVSLTCIALIAIFSLRLISILRPHFVKILSIPHAVANANQNLPYVGHITIPSSQINSIVVMQDYIKKHTKYNDHIYFFDNEPMMYMLVNRNNPTRFDLPETANTIEKRYEILNGLIKDRTKYVIIDTKAWPPDEISNRYRLPEVFQYVEEYYQKEYLGNYIIYVRKDTIPLRF